MRVTKLYFMGSEDEMVSKTLMDLRCVGLVLSLCSGAAGEITFVALVEVLDMRVFSLDY